MNKTNAVACEPLDAVIHAVQAAHSLDLSPYDEPFLRKSINTRLLATGIKNVAAYGDYLAEHRAEAKAFYGALRIGYSEFFRNSLTFALLEQVLLPNLVALKEQSGRGEIRVWSAGCAAGQEAWSVAILLDELTGAREKKTSYRIFGTDLSEPDIELARAGVYSASEVGNVRSRQLHDYFVATGKAYAIAPRLRARVDFSACDLLNERCANPVASIYGDFDVILCCNLLFYYRPEIRQRILDKLGRALAPDGYFVTGEAEKDIVARQEGLRAVAPPAAVFQKR